MADQTELDRIAAALHALRPEWPLTSLRTHLTKHHADRPYADLAIAAVVVALDPATQTPARLREHGPWWTAAQTAFHGLRNTTPAVGPGREPRCARPGHEHELARHCRACRSEQLATPTYPPNQPDLDPRALAAGDHR